MMLITVVFSRRNFGAELMASNGFGILDVPSETMRTALQWFTLLQENWVAGLYLLEVLDLVNYLMVGLMFLALFGALKRSSLASMVLALACSLMGVTLILASDQTFSMLTLSQQHAEATTLQQRAMFEAAGEALLVMDNPGAISQGTGTSVGLFLVLLAGLIASVVMLRSEGMFSKATGIVGLMANGVNICYFAMLVFAPAFYYLPTVLSVPFRVAWFVMVGLRLWRLGRGQRDPGQDAR